MTKSALVLGVPHQLQGPRFHGYVDDQSYGIRVRNLIQDGVDFVLEEATGFNPSTAETLTESILGAGHYLDIDPSVDERENNGIAKITGGGGPIDPCHSTDVCSWEFLEEQRKREELWLHKIQSQRFCKALVIVGLAHGLSIAFRLTSDRVDVREVRYYIPYQKLYTRPRP